MQASWCSGRPARRRRAPHRAARERASPGSMVGSHTTSSGRSATTSGSVIVPDSASPDRPSPGHPRRRRWQPPWPPTGAAGAACGCRPDAARRPACGHRPAARSRWRAAPRRGRARAAGVGRDRAGRPAGRRPSRRARSSSRARLVDVRAARARRPSRRPACAAPAGRSWSSRCGSACGEGTLRPSQSTNVPGLLHHRRDREDDVGQLGDGRVAQLQRDQERHPGQRLAGRGRVGQVVGVDPADARRPSMRCPRRPASQDLRAGRAAPRLGQQSPASRRPRSPARRGTQASRAPVRSASRATAEKPPGTLAEPLADEDDRAGSGSVDRRRAAGRLLRRERQRTRRAERLHDARGGERRDREDLQAGLAGAPCAAAGRRSATPPRARKPTSRTVPARLQIARRSRPQAPGRAAADTCERRKAASSALSRAGPEVDVVGAAARSRANLA